MKTKFTHVLSLAISLTFTTTTNAFSINGAPVTVATSKVPLTASFVKHDDVTLIAPATSDALSAIATCVEQSAFLTQEVPNSPDVLAVIPQFWNAEGQLCLPSTNKRTAIFAFTGTAASQIDAIEMAMYQGLPLQLSDILVADKPGQLDMVGFIDGAEQKSDITAMDALANFRSESKDPNTIYFAVTPTGVMQEEIPSAKITINGMQYAVGVSAFSTGEMLPKSDTLVIVKFDGLKMDGNKALYYVPECQHVTVVQVNANIDPSSRADVDSMAKVMAGRCADENTVYAWYDSNGYVGHYTGSDTSAKTADDVASMTEDGAAA